MDSITIDTDKHYHRANLMPELLSGLVLMVVLLVLADVILPVHVSVGLPVYGLAVALYTLLAGLILWGWHTSANYRDFGWANRVTLLRGMITVTLAALACFPDLLTILAWPFAVSSLAILLLDGVDGAIARSSGFKSAFGARFDMELDALLIVVLCIALVNLDKVGLWVLALGVMRYAFIIAGLFWPALQAPLPESFWRKTVCVWQIVTLMIAILPVVSAGFAFWTLALALVLLVYSFALDTVWLVRHRRLNPEQVTEPQSRSPL
ncbi:MAG: CDP-alcohol phosphatidyltransferase family protein [Marinobacter sp.]|uniref:CDP-alcohol phosphatidyltransferase family protein n=1 Tax=Marinobacter sp. TaxID=50741 RepID=UPI0034A02F6F